jgi:hypothetical protein
LELTLESRNRIGATHDRVAAGGYHRHERPDNYDERDNARERETHSEKV